MSKLRIDCGHGVTEIVNVAPNTTLGEVLGEVCTRRKLEPSGHALRHTLGGKKDNLDGSLSFRLSGLSNNAKLELVAAANRLAAPGECTLGLQLEDGSRKTAKVDSSSSLSLLEVIAQLAPEVAHVRSYSTWAAPLRPACSLLPGSHSWRLGPPSRLVIRSSLLCWG
jgi:hypothetical protein